MPDAESIWRRSASRSSWRRSRRSCCWSIGTPIAWWLARSQARWKEAVAAIVALPLVLPPTVLGFYLLVALGPHGPGGWLAGLFGGALARLHLRGPRDRLGHLLAAVRRAADPQRLRGLRRPPARGRGDAARLAAGCVLDGRRAAGAAGLSDRRGAGLRPYGRRVRRRADDRRQHPGRDQGALRRDLRLRRDAALGARPTSSPAACSSSPSR